MGCRVNRFRNELVLMMLVYTPVGQTSPPPGPKRFGPSTPIADRSEAMTPWPEVTVDDGVRREKVLCLAV
jgi:hypothetical protein